MSRAFFLSDNDHPSKVTAENDTEPAQEIIDENLTRSNKKQGNSNELDNQRRFGKFQEIANIGKVDNRENNVLPDDFPKYINDFGKPIDLVEPDIPRNNNPGKRHKKVVIKSVKGIYQ